MEPEPRLPFGLEPEHVTLGLLVLSSVLIVVLVQQNQRLRAGYLPKGPCGCEEETAGPTNLGDRFAPDMEGVNGNGTSNGNGLRPHPAGDSRPAASS